MGAVATADREDVDVRVGELARDVLDGVEVRRDADEPVGADDLLELARTVPTSPVAPGVRVDDDPDAGQRQAPCS